MNIEEVAKICHQANKALCEAFGDYSQPDWDNAEPWQRDSTINSIKFCIENPAATSADQHQAWCNDKIAAGWVYGEVKDEYAKTHPCMVGYDSLPPEQKAKDGVFAAIVNAAQ